MATRLNVGNETVGQLVRFAIVGFSLAAVYSAIYWYLATYVMSPLVAVLIAFLVSVTIGFVLHSRWSFRGHGAREDRSMKIKFLLVQASGVLRLQRNLKKGHYEHRHCAKAVLKA